MQVLDLLDEAKNEKGLQEMREVVETYEHLIINRSSLSGEQLRQFCREEKLLKAEEAQKYGLIDQILDLELPELDQPKEAS